MVEHRVSNSSSPDLSPALEAVLSSLNVDLEAELNRYRRTRHIQSSIETDIFADLDAVIEDSSNIDLDPAEHSIEVRAIAASPSTPPPLPRNKKLLEAPEAEHTARADLMAGAALTLQPYSNSSDHDSSHSALSNTLSRTVTDAATGFKRDEASSPLIKAPLGSGYLASSEKLIEDLTDVASLPDPIELDPTPRRRTISLAAGAALGLLALIAGLGASYIMSNPKFAQTFANGLSGDRAVIEPVPQPSFDPPGPNLSAQEFVDLKLDNLSSLDMQVSPDPLAITDTPEPPALPPIASPSLAPTTTATQSVSLTVGTNYYVTVPFSTEQGLVDVRQIVEEAFVRQFSDGNRIQLAVFNNPDTAQSFIAKLQTQGLQAQIYGPTTE